MPLSASGNKIMNAMIREYGSKKGKSVFYAKENKGGKFVDIVRKYKKKK
jgi:hypothetical protein